MTDASESLSEDLAAVEVHTTLLLETTRSLDPGSVHHPSLCPGWTRGHVLTHVARNADGMVNLVMAVTTGEQIPMYASPEARDGDIEVGAGRSISEQVADLEASAERWSRISSSLREVHAGVRVEGRGGVMLRGGYLPFMRLREVVLHHVDLDAGFGFARVDSAVTTRLLDDAVHRLRNNPATPSMTIRTDEGDSWSIGDGQPTASGSRTAVLGWLTRGLTDGVAGDLPTLPFGG